MAGSIRSAQESKKGVTFWVAIGSVDTYDSKEEVPVHELSHKEPATQFHPRSIKNKTRAVQNSQATGFYYYFSYFYSNNILNRYCSKSKNYLLVVSDNKCRSLMYNKCLDHMQFDYRGGRKNVQT